MKRLKSATLIIVDTSGSMGSIVSEVSDDSNMVSRAEYVSKQLLGSVYNLSESADNIGVLQFGNRKTEILLEMGSHQPKAIRQSLLAIRAPQGDTPLLESLMRGIDILDKTDSEKKTILAFSDGHYSDHDLSFADVLDRVRERENELNIRIGLNYFSLTPMPAAEINQLDRLLSKRGGSFGSISADDIVGTDGRSPAISGKNEIAEFLDDFEFTQHHEREQLQTRKLEKALSEVRLLRWMLLLFQALSLAAFFLLFVLMNNANERLEESDEQLRSEAMKQISLVAEKVAELFELWGGS